MRVNSFPRTVIEIVPPTGESFILAGGRNQRAFILPDTVSGFETPVEHTYRDSDRKSTRLNSSHRIQSRMPSSA